MDRFEGGFANLEGSAALVLKAGTSMVAIAKQLASVAKAGDLNASRRILDRLQGSRIGVEC